MPKDGDKLLKNIEMNFFIKDPKDEFTALPVPIPPPSLFNAPLPCCPLSGNITSNIQSALHYFKPIYLSSSENPINSITTIKNVPVHRILKQSFSTLQKPTATSKAAIATTAPVPVIPTTVTTRSSYVVRPSLFNTFTALSPPFQQLPHVVPIYPVVKKKLKHIINPFKASGQLTSIPPPPLSESFCLQGKKIEKLNTALLPYEPKLMILPSQRKGFFPAPFRPTKRPLHSLYDSMDKSSSALQKSNFSSQASRARNGTPASTSLVTSTSDVSTVHRSFSLDSHASTDTSSMSIPTLRLRWATSFSFRTIQSSFPFIMNDENGQSQGSIAREAMVMYLQKEQDTLISYLVEWLRQHSELNALLMPFIENLHFLSLLYLEQVTSATNDRLSDEFQEILQHPQMYFLKFSWDAYCLLKTFPPLFSTTSLLALIHLDETSPLTLKILQQTLGPRLEDPFVKSMLLYFHIVWALSPIKSPWESALCFLPVLTEKEWYHQLPVREFDRWKFPSQGHPGTECTDEVGFQAYLNSPTRKSNMQYANSQDAEEGGPTDILEKCAKMLAFIVTNFREIGIVNTAE